MNMTDQRWKWIRRILLLGTFLAAVKMIFFDYTMDEEYQIVMAYRSISSDSLFAEMWEPHQTSAFLTAILMRLYYAVTGTWTYLVLYLRVCTTLIQAVIAYALYRVLRGVTRERYAFLLALIFFNVVPKAIEIPEFSNMQLWFFTLTVLALMQYYFGCVGNGARAVSDTCECAGMGARPVPDTGGQSGTYTISAVQKRNIFLLVLAGICMSLEVLSFPSCVLLFPFFLVYIFIRSEKDRWRDSLLFAGTCGLCALIWLMLVLRNVSLSDFVRNVQYVLSFDATHDISGVTEGKAASLLSNLQTFAGLIALIVGISAVIFLLLQIRNGRRQKNKTASDACPENSQVGQYQKKRVKSEDLLRFCVICVTVSELVQLFYWMILESGYELPHIHFLVILIVGIVAWRYAKDVKKTLFMGIVGGFLSIAAVYYISDLEIYNALAHGWLCVLFCVVVLVLALEKQLGEQAERWIYFLLITLCLTCLVGKGYTIKYGRDYQTVLQTGSIMRYGPAAGILTDDWNAWIYNANYEDFTANIEEGDKVLIVTTSMLSESTTAYLFENCEVCHYSVVDPTDYDEKLLTYWELYPDKQPDVIVVDTWCGNLLTESDSWIMQYIENEFGYTAVTDGLYMRFYRRAG